MKQRLDVRLASMGLVSSRSQAESYIKLGQVNVSGKIQTKPGFMVSDSDRISLSAKTQYVSRAALKLASVSVFLKLDFQHKIILDVGSSTGGFTDFALKSGADKVIAVDVGTNQLHPTLHDHPKIELHEQTDIRDFKNTNQAQVIDMVVIDVSFISLREILPAVLRLASNSQVVAMVKPQFEAVNSKVMHKGVVKNEAHRRQILRDFEVWVGQNFKIINKADSKISGEKGNKERFYLLKVLRSRAKK